MQGDLWQVILNYWLASGRFYWKMVEYFKRYLSKSSFLQLIDSPSVIHRKALNTDPKIFYYLGLHACACLLKIYFRISVLTSSGLLHQKIGDQVVKTLSAWRNLGIGDLRKRSFSHLCFKTKAMTLSAAGFIISSNSQYRLQKPSFSTVAIKRPACEITRGRTKHATFKL